MIDFCRIFADKLADDYGIHVNPQDLVADGKLRHATPDGERPRSKKLAYILHDDDRPVGWFEHYPTAQKGSIRLGEAKPMTDAERAESRRRWAQQRAQEEAAQAARYDARAEYAARLWGSAVAVNRHPYLDAKGIASPGSVRIVEALPMGEFLDDPTRKDVERGVLLVPVYSGPGRIRSLQAITRGLAKLNLGGGQQGGCYHPIKGTDPSRVLVCEGYATGAALAAATGHSVVCAMSAKNLPAVARLVAQQAKGREVVICADNDHGTQERIGRNPGIDSGREAAEAIGARVVWPTGCEGTDWDDWLREGGEPAELRRIVAGEVGPPPDEGEPEARGEPEHDERGDRGAESASPATSPATVRRIRADLENATDPSDNLPAKYSEVNVARSFAGLHQGDLRYVAEWGRWMLWDGQRWRRDRDLSVFDLATRMCCAVADHARADPVEFTNERQRQATIARYGEKRTIYNMTEVSKADRRIAAVPEQWDADNWLLNTPAGVIDLRDGSRHLQMREAYQTRISSVAPGGDCPTWRRFLDEATGGDVEMQAYLQRIAGYCLTGSVREQAFWFIYGPGGNGKGVFINTLRRILGEYAQVAAADMFTERKHDAHPTELAGLQGARLVVAQETEEGKRWAEARVKMMTGEDPISARYMRQDFFEYMPQFKIIIAGNHKPGLRNVDEAIKRRLRLIPFEIKPAVKDATLPARLWDEAPGILQWAIDGCLEWQRGGLRDPERVLAATTEYLEQQDVLGNWIEECVQIPARGAIRRGDLYRSFKNWAEDAGEYVLPQKRFITAMESRGHVARTLKGVAVYDGIGLKSTDDGWGDP